MNTKKVTKKDNTLLKLKEEEAKKKYEEEAKFFMTSPTSIPNGQVIMTVFLGSEGKAGYVERQNLDPNQLLHVISAIAEELKMKKTYSVVRNQILAELANQK